MSTTSSLEERATSFATRVSEVISAFTDQPQPFRATAVEDRVTIRHADAALGEKYGISLNADGERLLSLVVDYDCSWDSDERYLSVEKSVIAVYPLDRTTRDPLFRYEYVRRPIGKVPTAHLQVHAHRDAFTHLLGFGGSHSKRARRREGRGLDRTPSVSEFHFPLGGPRFRPALEDILDVLQEEFGLECGQQWHRVRDEGREEWRRKQIAAATRDAPSEAIRVLRELGYTVTGDGAGDRRNKLTLL